jgi:hypothetical protein
MHKRYRYLLILNLFLLSMTRLNSQNEITERFPTLKGFSRTPIEVNSFANHLRKLPLKPDGTSVKYFNGKNKNNHNIYAAVVDLPIGTKDLHQCADAVIRLRADYLYKIKHYDQLHFNFTNGFKVDYSKWKQGYRVMIKGNKTTWIKNAPVSDSEITYWKYLELIWQYAGTASLEKEMKAISSNQLNIGDVFIKGGFPGHAVIVVDKALNSKGEIIFILAQSYMPAQELHILHNPSSSQMSPWYSLPNNGMLKTPEWTFTLDQLKRF